MAVGDFADRLRTMAENVLTLEVNTIICPHIEAEKMPPPEHAFIDVANEYRAWMRDRHNRDTWKPDEVASASREIFLMVRRAAGELLEAATERGVSDKNLLERIKTNSDQAIGIFDRLDGLPPRWPTIGIRLQAEVATDAPVEPVRDPVHLGVALIETAVEGAQTTRALDPFNLARTIGIDTTGIGSFDFDITPAQRDQLIAHGREAAKAFLAAHPGGVVSVRPAVGPSPEPPG